MVLLDEKATRKTETAVIAISSSVFALCLQIYGYTRPWYDWGRIATLPISAGFAIAGLILAQDDIRANRRQKQTQAVNDDIYSCGLEVYRTQTIEELTGARHTQPDYYMGEILQVDALPTNPNRERKPPSNLPKKVAANKITTLIIGGTRCGKSHLAKASLRELMVSQPQTEVLISAARNEGWLGWEQSPNYFISNGVDINGICKAVGSAFEIYDTRARQPESERASMTPVLLILDDWTGQSKSLDTDSKTSKLVNAQLASILNNGAAVNVRLWVTMHTGNLDCLKFMDSSTRSSVSIAAVGRTVHNPETGQEEGGYGVISTLLSNPTVFPGIDILPLKQELEERIQERDRGGEFQTDPLVLSRIGSNIWFQDLGVIALGDFRISLRQKEPPARVEHPDSSPSDFYLEKEHEKPLNPTNKISEGEVLAVKILEWCISKGGEITLRELKNNTRWAKDFSDKILLSAFSALQENGLAEYIVEKKLAGKISHILKAKLPK